MRKLIFPSVLVAFLCVLLSCNNIFTDDSSSKSSFGKALVSVSCGNGARTIMPTNLDPSDVTKLVLTAQSKNALGEYEAYSFAGEDLKEWASIASMNADSFEMDVGYYNFTLKVYAKSLAGEERVVQEAMLENKLVTAGINTISFEAKYVSTGELSLKFLWDSIEKAGKTMSPISKLSINLYKINTDGSIGDPVFAESLDCRCAKVEEVGAGGTKSVYEAIFAPQEEVTNGSYFIIIKVCDIYDESKVLNTITDIVKVKGYKTEKTINLDITKMNISNDEYTFYVAESGNDETGDGSAALPFASIAGAVSKMDNSSEIYSIVIIGKLTTEQRIKSTFTTSDAKGLVILGLADDCADGLQRNYTSSEKGTMLSISSSVPVTIKNITISGGYSGQGSAGGIVLTSGAKLTMESGIITGNTGEDGGQAVAGGVMVKASSKFIMNDGKICGNTGGGVCIYDGSNPGSEFIMNGGEISGNTASKGAGVQGVYSTTNNAQFTMNGGKIIDNTASSDGGGIYLCGQFTLTGGEISGNTAGNLGNGIFVYFGTLSIEGRASITDVVYLRENQKITISGAIETSGIAATVLPQTYTKGTQILTLADGVDKSEIAKIALTKEEWALDDTGKLYMPYVLYVSGTGNDTTGDGSEENPYKTIAGACAKIAEDGKPTANWTILVSGEITGIPTGTSGLSSQYGKSEIPDSITTEKARSILLTGATGLDGDGIPQDKINRAQAGDANGVTNGTVLVINTPVPVTITNLMITGGYGSSRNAGGINIAEGATLSLGDGALITGNRNPTNGRGGAIHNEGTLFMYGSAVVGDKTNGGKTDESSYTYAADSSSYQTFNNKGMANYASTGGGIYNGDESTGSTISAKLYLGYKLGSDGTPVKEELTGGLYYNSGSGGALYNAARSFVYFDSGTFAWNGTCGSGGAIRNGAGGTIEMTGGEIIYNRSYQGGNYTSYGGGIANAASTSKFIMSGGVINHNISANDSGYGGGVYNCGKFFMYGTAVIGDKDATEVASADSWGNKAQRGGAIYNQVNTSSGEVGGLYIGYKPDESGNPVEAELTGGIYHNYSFYTTTSTSDANKSGGGAIESTGTLKIASGTIAYNATSGYGGAIRQSPSNTYPFEISGGTIKDNSAGKLGGAIFIASGNSSVLTLSGDVSIPAGADGKHDIYLSTNTTTFYQKITLAGSLGDSFEARLTPGFYDSSMAIFLNSDSPTFETDCAKFSVTPQVVEDEVDGNETIEWSIGSDGKLTTSKSSIGLNVGFSIVSSDIEVEVTADGNPMLSGTSVSGTEIVFTAAADYASYSWILDGVEKSTTNTFEVVTTAFVNGVYDIVLEASDSDGKKYSFYAQIKKD